MFSFFKHIFGRRKPTPEATISLSKPWLNVTNGEIVIDRPREVIEITQVMRSSRQIEFTRRFEDGHTEVAVLDYSSALT